MTRPQPGRGYGDSVILHLIPADTLRELSARARRLRHEEAFRRHVLSRFWTVFPMVLFIFAAGLSAAWLTVVAMLLVLALTGVQSLPHFVAQLVLYVPAFAAFLVSQLVLLNRLFAWLEARMPREG